MDWWVPPELRQPWHVLPAYPPRDPLPEMGPHPLLPNPDSARTESCGTTESKGSGSGSGGNWDSYYRNMEAAAGGSFAHGQPGSSGSAGAGSATSASSGGRAKEPNDALAEAMKAQDPYNWQTVWEMMTDPVWGTLITLPLALLSGPLTVGRMAIGPALSAVAPGDLMFLEGARTLAGKAAAATGELLYSGVRAGSALIDGVVHAAEVNIYKEVAAGGARAGWQQALERAAIKAINPRAAQLAENRAVAATMEDRLYSTVGGEREVYVGAPEYKRGRRFDVRVGNTGYEAKSGEADLVGAVQVQAEKDGKILAAHSGRVDRIVWVFQEGQTGKGPTPRLLQRLKELGIHVTWMEDLP